MLSSPFVKLVSWLLPPASCEIEFRRPVKEQMVRHRRFCCGDEGEANMVERDEDWIAKRAYALWEEEGRPDGRHESHWQEAALAWEALHVSASQTSANAVRRIRSAKIIAEQEGLPPQPAPIPTPRRPRAPKKG